MFAENAKPLSSIDTMRATRCEKTIFLGAPAAKGEIRISERS
jgi:hypothetical protein